MFRIISLFCCVLICATARSQTTSYDVKDAKIVFDSTIITANIVSGTRFDGYFHFKNAGTGPLIIENVQTATDDCVADYTKEPVIPGEKGVIKVSIGPSGDARKLLRYVFVKVAGKDDRIVLKVTGRIIAGK